MNSIEQPGTDLDDIKIHVRLKMSALWSSVMFCYIYADYFGLYVPGSLQRMLAGKMGPLGDSNGLVGDFCDASDPEPHDFSVTSSEAQSQSLAEHCLGRALYRDHSHHDVALGVLYILRSHRDRADGTRGLVCMELAQAENKIISIRQSLRIIGSRAYDSMVWPDIRIRCSWANRESRHSLVSRHAACERALGRPYSERIPTRQPTHIAQRLHISREACFGRDKISSLERGKSPRSASGHDGRTR